MRGSLPGDDEAYDVIEVGGCSQATNLVVTAP